MKSYPSVLTAAILLGAASMAGAQASSQNAGTAPLINQQTHFLHMTREWVKPGQLSTVVQIDKEKAKALRDANWPRPLLGFTSVTGTDEVLYLSFYEDMGPLETERHAIDQNPTLKAKLDKDSREAGEQMTNREDIMTVYHPDVTYRPNWNWAKTRCIDLIRVHLNAAKGGEYFENRKMTLESHERGNLDTHVFLYSVVSGHPSWTWYIIRPTSGLDHLDYLRKEGFGEPFSDEEKKRQIELFGQAAASEEEKYFCADPSISSVPDSWSGADSSFWDHK